MFETFFRGAGILVGDAGGSVEFDWQVAALSWKTRGEFMVMSDTSLATVLLQRTNSRLYMSRNSTKSMAEHAKQTGLAHIDNLNSSVLLKVHTHIEILKYSETSYPRLLYPRFLLSTVRNSTKLKISIVETRE